MPNPAPRDEVSFLCSDIEGSTALWEACPESMARALREHDALFRETSATLGGYEVKAEGDAFLMAFADSGLALRFAVVVQENLASMTWPTELIEAQRSMGIEDRLGLRVRMGMSRGPIEASENSHTGRMEYAGAPVKLAQSLCDLAHGAQVIADDRCFAGHAELVGGVLKPLGPIDVRGFEGAVPVTQLVSGSWWPREFPPLRFDVEHIDPKAQRLERGGTLEDHVSAACDKLLAQVVVDRRAGQLEEAERNLECLEATTRWLADSERSFESCIERVLLHANKSQPETSLEWANKALELARMELSDFLLIDGLQWRARALIWLGRTVEARSTVDEAMQVALRLGDEQAALMAESDLANISMVEGRFDEAQRQFTHAISEMEASGLRNQAMRQRRLLATMYLEYGDPRGVVESGILMDFYGQLGLEIHVATTRINLSLYYLERGEAAEFHDLNQAALKVFRRTNYPGAVPACVINEAYLHLDMGNVDEASSLLVSEEEALAKDPPAERSETELVWALVHLHSGDQTAVIRSANRGLILVEEDRGPTASTKRTLLEVARWLAQDEPEQAIAAYQSLAPCNSVGVRVAARVMGRLLYPKASPP